MWVIAALLGCLTQSMLDRTCGRDVPRFKSAWLI